MKNIKIKKGLIVIIFSIMTLNILLSGCIESDSLKGLSIKEIPPIILFDEKDDSLFVLTASKDLDWSNIKIKSGECNLPSGFISAGDELTKCSGFLVLIWTPTNTVIGKWDFN